jgi:hypothetical protein
VDTTKGEAATVETVENRLTGRTDVR